MDSNHRLKFQSALRLYSDTPDSRKTNLKYFRMNPLAVTANLRKTDIISTITDATCMEQRGSMGVM